MPKSRHRRNKKKPPRSFERSAPNKFTRDLMAAEGLLDDEKYVEAQDAFEELDRRFPNQEDVLVGLVNAAFHLNDMLGYQHTVERLTKFRPDDPDLALALAEAYLNNLRLTLARHAFSRFLERWPDDERAPEIVETITDLKRLASDRLRKLGVSQDEEDELGALHDQSQVFMEQRRLAEARETLEKLIERKPEFTAAHNNLSLVCVMERNLDAAFVVAQQVIEIEPSNYHALSNLVRFHVHRGETDRARRYAERLKSVVDEEMVDIWLKKIEALSFLGDDQGVISVFDQAENSGHRDVIKFLPQIFHLVAAAEMRLGNEDRARELWQRTLSIASNLDLARHNLDDLKKPIAERHAPWPFSLGDWMLQQPIDDLVSEIKSAEKRGGEKTATIAMRLYFDQHSELQRLVPILLERGDPRGRELAMQLVTLGKTPEMLTSLRDFALSKNGPDQMRLRAAQIAKEEGVLPEDVVRLWIQGKWRDILQTTAEIHDQPLFDHPPKVRVLIKKGIELMQKGDGVGAELAFKQALQLESDAPDIANNLAASYNLQGRTEESEQLIRETHEQHPDYLFATTNLAKLHIQHRKFEEAAELLKPLISRKRLHFSEVASICDANLFLYTEQNDPEKARVWLTLWEQIDPDHPNLQKWQMQLEVANLPDMVRNLLQQYLPR